MKHGNTCLLNFEGFIMVFSLLLFLPMISAIIQSTKLSITDNFWSCPIAFFLPMLLKLSIYCGALFKDL